MANIRDIQELKSYVARIEGQISDLVTELNKNIGRRASKSIND
jgi:hypothetical protein